LLPSWPHFCSNNKALERRNADPEGAITIARTLLETVCKRILDQLPGAAYTDKEDLPKLYGMVARALNLARISIPRNQ
jgi:hypothetical protein